MTLSSAFSRYAGTVKKEFDRNLSLLSVLFTIGLTAYALPPAASDFWHYLQTVPAPRLVDAFNKVGVKPEDREAITFVMYAHGGECAKFLSGKQKDQCEQVKTAEYEALHPPACVPR